MTAVTGVLRFVTPPHRAVLGGFGTPAVGTTAAMTQTMDNTNTPADEIATLIASLDSRPNRQDTIAKAAALGADLALLNRLVDAARVSYSTAIILPAERLEGLSRGSGWCRQGKGAGAVWGERTEHGYRVGPGKWIVGGSDGFNRKSQTPWTVKHVQVGPETWTVAD